MAWVALTCPQCSAPLPRVALWRSVKCGSCGALITRTESVVTRDSFRQALNRARQHAASVDAVLCGDARYQLIRSLGAGEISDVRLACRITSLPLLVTIKLSSAPTAAARFAREAHVAEALQALAGDGAAAYFSRLLPEAIACGPVEGNEGKQALVLRHPSGFWGSLAALNERFAAGLDPRHAVWIWRRMLEVLNFLHHHGWSHGDVRPEHALAHPQDHSVRLIGWAAATKDGGEQNQISDLCRSARVIQVLLCGANSSGVPPAAVPAGLAQLISKAAADEDFCRSHRANGLDALLKAEARAAFGSPSFVPLTL